MIIQRTQSIRIAAIMMLGLAAAIAGHGVASANPEMDRCGRDISSGPLAEPCLLALTGKAAALETKAFTALAPPSASCGTRSPGACATEEDSRR